jgi:hypothetical protein
MTITTDFSSTHTQAEHLKLAESNTPSGGQFSWVTKSEKGSGRGRRDAPRPASVDV